MFIKSLWGGFILGIVSIASLIQFPKSLVFPIGLILIIVCGFKLFTGNIYLLKDLKPVPRIKLLTISWIGNLIGSLIAIKFITYVNPDIITSIRQLVLTKENIPLPRLLVSAIGCNFLVCMATYLYKKYNNIVLIYLPVFLFVLLGLEHIVADMVFLPYFIFNKIIPFFMTVTIGNIIGGLLFNFSIKERS